MCTTDDEVNILIKLAEQLKKTRFCFNEYYCRDEVVSSLLSGKIDADAKTNKQKTEERFVKCTTVADQSHSTITFGGSKEN